MCSWSVAFLFWKLYQLISREPEGMPQYEDVFSLRSSYAQSEKSKKTVLKWS